MIQPLMIFTSSFLSRNLPGWLTKTHKIQKKKKTANEDENNNIDKDKLKMSNKKCNASNVPEGVMVGGYT